MSLEQQTNQTRIEKSCNDAYSCCDGILRILSYSDRKIKMLSQEGFSLTESTFDNSFNSERYFQEGMFLLNMTVITALRVFASVDLAC